MLCNINILNIIYRKHQVNIPSLKKPLSEMSLDEINQAIKDRTDWIENHISASLNGEDSIDIEPLRDWSNELYALNSFRLQRVSQLKDSA